MTSSAVEPADLPANPPAVPAPAATDAGHRDHRLAASCLVAAMGLVGHATAYALGWAGWSGPALVLWYAALVVLVVPFALLLTSAEIGRAHV